MARNPDSPGPKKEARIRNAARQLSGYVGDKVSRANAAGLREVRARGLNDEDWINLIQMSRELMRQNAIDQVVRACDMAPEMLGLLVDCARGENSFEGASAAVRRLAILDVLGISTGTVFKDSPVFENPLKNQDVAKRGLGELEEFISAGINRLKQLDMQKAAIDATVIEDEPGES